MCPSIHEETQALVSPREMCPCSPGAGRTGWLCRPCRQEAALGHCTELTAGRSRAGSHWALTGRVIAPNHTPAWPLAAAGFCHTSHSHPQGADLPHAAAKPSPEQTESGRSPGRECWLRPQPRHGKINKQAFLSQGGTSRERHFLNPSATTRAAATPPTGWNIFTSGLPFATEPPAWPRRCGQCGHSCHTLSPKVAQL